MKSSRAKRQRLLQSYVPPRPDLPATFESLSDDPLTTVLEFLGKKSYRSFGGVNKHCKEVYLNTPGMTKETFLFGYAPLSFIIDKIERVGRIYHKLHKRVGKGVLFYNRRDVMDWALQERKKYVLSGICKIATEEGRINILNDVWNNVNEDKRSIFRCVDECAAHRGKLNVMKWAETKGLFINEVVCAHEAAWYGHLHIIQWLREEKGLELDGDLYDRAIYGGGHLHVMKWLREQEVTFHEWTFAYTADNTGNLKILQWLHDERCPWPEDYCARERRLKPEALAWLRVNGYSDRIM